MPEQRCGTCKFFAADEKNLAGPGSCRRDPPTAFMVMMQGPRGQPQPAFMSADPAVSPKDQRFCWKPKYDFEIRTPPRSIDPDILKVD